MHSLSFMLERMGVHVGGWVQGAWSSCLGWNGDWLGDVYSFGLCGEENVCVVLRGYSCQHWRSRMMCASVNDARMKVDMTGSVEVYIMYR
jgi:hypothetical protein